MELRSKLLGLLPDDLLLSRFHYEEKYLEKTGDYMVSLSIPVEINLVNFKDALDHGMSSNVIPMVLSGRPVINYFCFAVRTFGDSKNFYLWSETEEVSPLKLPYFQSIEVDCREYGLKPIDAFNNSISGITCRWDNEESITYYIKSTAQRSKLFLKDYVEKVNVSMFLLELFIAENKNSIELLKVDSGTTKTVERYADGNLIKSISVNNETSMKSTIKRLVQ